MIIALNKTDIMKFLDSNQPGMPGYTAQGAVNQTQPGQMMMNTMNVNSLQQMQAAAQVQMNAPQIPPHRGSIVGGMMPPQTHDSGNLAGMGAGMRMDAMAMAQPGPQIGMPIPQMQPPISQPTNNYVSYGQNANGIVQGLNSKMCNMITAMEQQGLLSSA